MLTSPCMIVAEWYGAPAPFFGGTEVESTEKIRKWKVSKKYLDRQFMNRAPQKKIRAKSSWIVSFRYLNKHVW